MNFLTLTFGFFLLYSIESTRADGNVAIPDALNNQLEELQFSLNRQLLENQEQVEALVTELQQLKNAVDHLVWLSERMDRSVQVVAADNSLLARNVSILTYQNEEIVLNQQYCANHEALKNLFFELKPKCAPSDTEFPQLVPGGTQYRSCREAPKRSGVYTFNLAPVEWVTTTAALPSTTSGWVDRPSSPFRAFCEQQKFGGGWMTIQKRQDGSVDFNRTLDEYRDGFGNPRGEYWLGVEKIHRLTGSGYGAELLILMEDFDDRSAYAWYQNFRVLNEQNGYRMYVGTSNGTAGNALSIYGSEVFVTHDANKSYSSCARQLGSGFWHYGCSVGDNRNNLNGIYGRDKGVPQGIWWGGIKSGSSYAMLKRVQMLVRPYA